MMFKQVFKTGFLNGLKTTWILGKIIFPITLLVTILSYTPVIEWVLFICTPLMQWIGLSGEAAIPFALANVLNLYAGIGAILSLDLTVKEVLILALMMSFSHNLLVESAVAIKVGVRVWVAVGVRLGLAVLTAFVINLFWSGGAELAQYGFIAQTAEIEVSGWLAILGQGLQKASLGIAQMALIVIPLMIFIQWMKESKVLSIFTKGMLPFTRLLGLAPNSATTLSAGLLFGLAFGAGVIIQAVQEDNIAKKDMYLIFIFLVACHAVIEDTLIFIPLGIPVWPLFLFRLLTAVALTMIVAFIWNRVEKNKALLTESKGA